MQIKIVGKIYTRIADVRSERHNKIPGQSSKALVSIRFKSMVIKLWIPDGSRYL